MTGLSALLSIHPRYVARILSGEKRFEYRRVLPQKHINHLVLYSTAPVSKITALAEVRGFLSGPLDRVWAETASKSGISEQVFRAYFAGKSHARAFVLGEVSELKSPVPLSALPGSPNPPRSFRYLDKATTEQLLTLR